MVKKEILIVVDEKTKREIKLFAKVSGMSVTRYLVGLHKKFGQEFAAENKVVDPITILQWKKALRLGDDVDV